MKADMVYDYIKRWQATCADKVDFVTLKEMNNLMDLCHKEMLMDEAKSSGTKKIVTAANRIIKNAVACWKYKEQMHGMFPNTLCDGSVKWCVCDGYHGVRFNDKMALKEADIEGKDVFNLNDICKPVDGAVEIQLPNIVDVKLAVKDGVIKDKKGKKVGMKPYCINTDIPLYVNPQYLLDMMECLPDAKAYAHGSVSIIYFEADNGDGCLCPVNPTKK